MIFLKYPLLYIRVTQPSIRILSSFFGKRWVQYKKMKKHELPFIENEHIFWDVPKEEINMNIGTEGVVNSQF